jgi:hypothetical protein
LIGIGTKSQSMTRFASSNFRRHSTRDCTEIGGLCLNARRMPDLAYHLLSCSRVSTSRELLIQQVQAGYCDKGCTNEFHGTPSETISAGKDDEESGAELGRYRRGRRRAAEIRPLHSHNSHGRMVQRPLRGPPRKSHCPRALTPLTPALSGAIERRNGGDVHAGG